MKDIYSKIAEVIKQMAPTKGTLLFPAKVTAIDGETCTVDIENIILTDVRLKAVVNGKDEQMVIEPKVGSMVMVADLSDGNLRDCMVIQVSEIQRIGIAMKDTTIEITNDGVTINDGKNGGLCITPELVKQLNVLTARVDAIYRAIEAAPIGTADGGLAFKSGLVAQLSAVIQKEDFSYIEDTKVKH